MSSRLGLIFFCMGMGFIWGNILCWRRLKLYNNDEWYYYTLVGGLGDIMVEEVVYVYLNNSYDYGFKGKYRQ